MAKLENLIVKITPPVSDLIEYSLDKIAAQHLTIKNHQAVIQDFTRTVEKKDRQIEDLKNMLVEAYEEGFGDGLEDPYHDFDNSEAKAALDKMFPKDSKNES